MSKVAVGIDVRNGSGIDEIPQTLEQLRQKNFPYEILFLDAEDEGACKAIQGDEAKPSSRRQ